MFPKETALRILQRCLSGKGKKIFRNQVQFYNIVFGVTNGENCPEKWIQIMLSQKKEEADAAEIRDVNQYLESGLDNSSSNVGKHINDEPRMSIPKQHCIHFSQSEKRKEIEPTHSSLPIRLRLISFYMKHKVLIIKYISKIWMR